MLILPGNRNDFILLKLFRIIALIFTFGLIIVSLSSASGAKEEFPWELFYPAFIHKKLNPPQIANLSVSERNDGSYLIDIFYDVIDLDSNNLWVGVAVSKNSGDWYGVTPCATALAGDYGDNITPGTNKHIVWNAAQTLPVLHGDTYKIRLTVSDWPSQKSSRNTSFGSFAYFWNFSGNSNFVDGRQYLSVNHSNYQDFQQYQAIAHNGESIIQAPVGEWSTLLYQQPDAATREWWTHQLRQFVDAGFDFILYSTFGKYQMHARDCDSCSYETDPNCKYDRANDVFQPDYGAMALGKIIDEMGFPLKIALFCDVPGCWYAYNFDKMRLHYGEGNWCDYMWLDNGQDPDGIISTIPINNANFEKYLYDHMIKPFFENFNRPQDRMRWQTHNDKPVENGGRPVIYIYAGGTQWFRDYENAGPAFQHIKNLFKTDFGVEPFLAIDDHDAYNSWFGQLKDNPAALAELESVADAKQAYSAKWVWGDKNPPDPQPNSWEFKNYRISRLSLGFKVDPDGRWMDYGLDLSLFAGLRWIYIDKTEGENEEYFLDREWQYGMTNVGYTRAPDQCIIGHTDEYDEGEMWGLMSDYLKKDGGYLKPDYYIKKIASKIDNYNSGNPASKSTAESVVFAIGNP